MTKFLKPKSFRTKEQEYEYWMNIPIFHPRVIFDFNHRGLKSNCLNSRDEFLLIIVAQTVFIVIITFCLAVWFGTFLFAFIKTLLVSPQTTYWILFSGILFMMIVNKIYGKFK